MTRFGQQKGNKDITVFSEQNKWYYFEKFRYLNIIKNEVNLENALTSNIDIMYSVLRI
jgi:hypothetical protein